ncbi:fibroblast growth factor receptor homolog 1-like [Ptychodera flava]|uniref:fibroblast growth factor receptor homolog 1-like n=1 Tax=Ptychodera flava TaxID=63121 RepID=UPI00396A3030
MPKWSQEQCVLPLKWMPPESLTRGIFQFESDMWSFGVFLWELASLGKAPFVDVNNSNEIIRLVLSGERLEKPTRCRLRLYKLMMQCWSSPLKLRPSTDVLLEEFDDMIQRDQGPFIGNFQHELH